MVWWLEKTGQMQPQWPEGVCLVVWGVTPLRLPIRASLLTSCMATQMILPPLPRLLVGVTLPQRVGLGIKKEIMSENNVI